MTESEATIQRETLKIEPFRIPADHHQVGRAWGFRRRNNILRRRNNILRNNIPPKKNKHYTRYTFSKQRMEYQSRTNVLSPMPPEWERKRGTANSETKLPIEFRTFNSNR